MGRSKKHEDNDYWRRKSRDKAEPGTVRDLGPLREKTPKPKVRFPSRPPGWRERGKGTA